MWKEKQRAKLRAVSRGSSVTPQQKGGVAKQRSYREQPRLDPNYRERIGTAGVSQLLSSSKTLSRRDRRGGEGGREARTKLRAKQQPNEHPLEIFWNDKDHFWCSYSIALLSHCPSGGVCLL
jgi:hypothetical protein